MDDEFSIVLTSTSSTLQQYHMKTLLNIQLAYLFGRNLTTHRYGLNFSAISNISSSFIYFHFPPPFAFNFPTSLPTSAAIPLCTPKSPVLKTSILFNPKQANISTLH